MKIDKELYEKIKRVEEECLKEAVTYTEALRRFKEINVDKKMVLLLIQGELQSKEEVEK